MRTVRRDPSVNINNVIDVANIRAELLDVQKRYAALKERLDTERVINVQLIFFETR